MTSTLRCTKCKLDLPIERFSFARVNKHRQQRHSWCTPCVVADNRRRRQADPIKARALGSKHARIKRIRRYGIEPADYDRMFMEQGGACAICGKPETVSSGRIPTSQLAIDHDHTTGKVRGLLCFMCNTAIGKLRDDPAVLRRAAAYIEASRQEP